MTGSLLFRIHQAAGQQRLHWTYKRAAIILLAFLSLAALAAVVKMSLRYDNTDAGDWWWLYFLNALISWGQWAIWIPILINFIHFCCRRYKSPAIAYPLIGVFALFIACGAATLEGLAWHHLYNESSEWPWARVWKAFISNRLGFHILFGLMIILFAAIRQLLLISKAGKNSAFLIRKGYNNLSGSLIIRHQGKTEFIPLQEISHLTASGSYVDVFTKKGKLTVTGSLKQFVAQLPSPHFVRIHRSFVVRTDQVAKLTPLTNDDYLITTCDGHELRLSRSYKSALPLLKGVN